MKNKLNHLSNKEWLRFTKSWFLSDSHSQDHFAQSHPATFNPYDIEKIIRFFTRRGERALDPFGGVGSTLVACERCNRRGTQIELYPRHHRTTLERLHATFGVRGLLRQKSLLGCSREWLQIMEGVKFDFLITSPPYWNMMRRGSKDQTSRKEYEIPREYGDSEKDIGNCEKYHQFMFEFWEIMNLCNGVLKEGAYVVVIVRDFRIGKRYTDFHHDIANILERCGYLNKGVRILCHDNIPLRPFGLGSAFVPNVHHDYILIHQKDKDTQKIIAQSHLTEVVE